MPAGSPEAVREALDRIVSSPGFAGAGRLGPFLRFVVERALGGDPVKESIIGVEVFGRPADYDPRIDPIVRVEARRLRSRLTEYYEGVGSTDTVRIGLPRGTYVPVFTQADVPGETPPRGRKWRKITGIAAVAVVAFAALPFLLFRRSAAPPEPVVAVLPFLNLSDDKSNEYFSDGLTEELTDRLARVPGLRVVARSSAFRFKAGGEDLREVGRKLNATAVVEGSVRRSGDRLRVTAQIIDVENGLHLWSETYERTLSDVFAIQDDVARAIANALRAELRVGFASQQAPPTTSLDAYHLYLKGRYHLNHNAMAGLELAARDFEQAVALDPNFAAAHGLLAMNYGLLGYYRLRPASEVWPLARASAGRAVALDPKLAAGHASLGLELGMHEWNWQAAELSLRRAVALDPRSSDARVALAIAYLVPTGRLEDAIRELRRALEFDPQSYLASIGLSYSLLAHGSYSEAVSEYRRAVEINPSHTDAQWDLGMALALAGEKDAALKQFRMAGQVREGSSWMPGAIEFALLADPVSARKRLTDHDHSETQRPMFVAYCFGALGDAGEAAAWLEKAWAERDPQLIWLKVDPRFAKVRTDPRVAAMIHRLGLATP
jgi:serine/threonine-protein kinase